MKKQFFIFFCLLFIIEKQTKAQSWSLTGNTLFGTEILGSTSGNFDLNIKNGAAYNINFSTGGTQRMTILGNTNPGYVGIGTTSPSQLLEVSGGNMNLATATNYYMLGGANILGHKGNVSNIFVGVNAGSSSGNLASHNTYMGNAAGFTGTGNTTNNINNAFYGDSAGYTNTAKNNTLIGHSAGMRQTTVDGNTFIGALSGYYVTTGGESVFVGYKSGFKSSSSFATKNTFVGYQSGTNNVSGSSNSFFGDNAGTSTVNGSLNTFLGYAAGSGANGQANTATGANALNSVSGSNNVANGFFAMNFTSSGNQNVAVGDSVLTVNTTGSSNTAAGSNALHHSTGDKNSAFGYQALYLSTASGNNAFGYQAMYGNTTGKLSDAYGYQALYTCSTGVRNVAIGDSAQFKNASFNYNTAVGYKALYKNNNGDGNSAFGHAALTNSIADGQNDAFGYNSLATNTTGNANAGFGYLTLTQCTTGVSNTAIGNSALSHDYNGSYNTGVGAGALLNVTGDKNTSLGYDAGSAITSGTNNTLLGYNATVSTGTLVNSAAIGSGATVTTNSTMILGDNSVNVGIGYSNASLVTNAKFDVQTTGLSISGGSNGYGIYSINTNTATGSFGIPPTNAFNYGVYGEASGSANTYAYNYGGSFKATTGANCIGVGGVSVGPGSGASESVGGYFNASYTGTVSAASYGVMSFASNGGTNYGVYSSVANVTGNYAGFFIGDVHVNGVNSGSGYLTVSDQVFKRSISDISNPLATLRQLKPKSYYYDTANTKGFYFPKSKQYGFIAQDLQTVLPELVSTIKRPAILNADGTVAHGDTTHLAVNYDGLIALLAASIQKLDSVNQALQNQINSCCAAGNRTSGQGGNSGTGSLTPGITGGVAESGSANNAGSPKAGNTLNVELSDANVVVLNQNVPNPFAEQTAISYNIPQNAGFAQILFYDANGRLIQAVDIVKKGQGTLNVFANDLSNGTYSYTLVIDGKIYDTKKMVKQ